MIDDVEMTWKSLQGMIYILLPNRLIHVSGGDDYSAITFKPSQTSECDRNKLFY